MVAVAMIVLVLLQRSEGGALGIGGGGGDGMMSARGLVTPAHAPQLFWLGVFFLQLYRFDGAWHDGKSFFGS